MGGFIIAGCLFGTICGGLSPDGRWYVAPQAAPPQAQYRCMVGDPRCEMLPPLGWRLEPLRPPVLPRNAIPPSYDPTPPPRITMPHQPPRRPPPPPRVESRSLPPVPVTPPTVELPRPSPPEELDGGPVLPLEPSPPSHPPRPYIQR